MIALFGLGGALVVGAAAVWASSPNDAAAVLWACGLGVAGYSAALVALSRLSSPLPRPIWAAVVVVAVAARLLLVAAPPVLEDDVNRYLWDGAVTLSGESPYRFSPQQVWDWRAAGEAGRPDERTDDGVRLAALARLSIDVDLAARFDDINYPSVPTIYPPLAQYVFALSASAAPGSIAVVKAILLLFDGLVAAAVVLLLQSARRPRRWVVAYAWSPLVLVSFAGAAHMDAIPVALLALSVAAAVRGRARTAGGLLGAAVAAKLFPLLALPALLRRLGPAGAFAAAATAAVLYLPFALEPRLFEGLATFAERWRFNGAGFPLVAAVVGDGLARPLCGLAAAGVAVVAARRGPRQPIDVVAAVGASLAALVLLAPVVNPWYVAWLVPFAAVLRSPAGLTLSATCLLYYAEFLPGGRPGWVHVAQYALPAAVFAATRAGALAACWSKFRRPPERPS